MNETAPIPTDASLEEAMSALAAGHYLRCETLAAEALRKGHQHQAYDRMSRIVLTLMEARRHKRQMATAVRKIRRLHDEEEMRAILEGEQEITPGCYLIEPMLVAADGRELREKANAEGIATLIVVREPQTQLGLWPVVMVGPETVRTQVHPPKRISSAWMLTASEALGRDAAARVDTQASPAEQVDHLMDLIETAVDSEELHQMLERACRDAAHGSAARSTDAVAVESGQRAQK